MKKEQSDYYFEKNGYIFLFSDIFDKINKEHLELKKRLFNDEISKNEFKKEYSNGFNIIKKATKSIKTRREFINEYLRFKISEKIAKQKWKHEREHCKRIYQQGMKAKISLVYIVSRDEIQNRNMKFMLIPATYDFGSELFEKLSLEKFKEYALKVLNVTSLSDMDKKQKVVLENQP